MLTFSEGVPPRIKQGGVFALGLQGRGGRGIMEGRAKRDELAGVQNLFMKE